MSLSTPEAPPAVDKRQVTLDLLTALKPLWSVERERRKRTAPITEYFVPSGDATVERDWQKVAGEMDDLLDQHNIQKLGTLALAGIEHEQIISEHAVIPPQGFEAPDGRGTQ